MIVATSITSIDSICFACPLIAEPDTLPETRSIALRTLISVVLTFSLSRRCRCIGFCPLPSSIIERMVSEWCFTRSWHLSCVVDDAAGDPRGCLPRMRRGCEATVGGSSRGRLPRKRSGCVVGAEGVVDGVVVCVAAAVGVGGGGCVGASVVRQLSGVATGIVVPS